VVVASSIDSAAALRRLAEQLRLLVRSIPFGADGAVIPVTVSVGAALLDGATAPDTVERRANLALAEAKHAGDRVVVWNQRPAGVERRDRFPVLIA
jgi:GGDEF domain-containing protein